MSRMYNPAHPGAVLRGISGRHVSHRGCHRIGHYLYGAFPDSERKSSYFCGYGALSGSRNWN